MSALPKVRKNTQFMYIGALSKLTGASRKAIRLYEAIGLIPAPSRQGKYRVYTYKDVALVHMIRRGQAVGFNLAELKALVAYKARTGQFPLELASELIAKKRGKLRNDMDKIKTLDQQLIEMHEELKRTFG